MTDIKTLEYKKVDIEPEEVPPINVPLGESSYIAHCPNDYEFIALMGEIRKFEDDPENIDLAPIIGAFFRPQDVKQIDKKLRSGQISFIAELSPALTALADHFRPAVESRLQQIHKKLSSPKGR